MERDPAAAQVILSDLDRFANVYRRLPAMRDTIALFEAGNLAAHDYGNRNEWQLWAKFRCEMTGTETGD